MIKQNHSNVAALTMVVVILGCGLASTKTDANVTPHKRVSEEIHKRPHNEQRNRTAKKDKKAKLSKSGITRNHSSNVKQVHYKARGVASWYGYESGNRTAMGTRFNPMALTAAHRTLPLSTKVKVTNVDNHKSVVVTINDRGPYAKGRIVDLSLASAKALGIKGVGHVELEAVN